MSNPFRVDNILHPCPGVHRSDEPRAKCLIRKNPEGVGRQNSNEPDRNCRKFSLQSTISNQISIYNVIENHQSPIQRAKRLTGKTISHYKILEEIGAGGMGVVYKAEDTKLQRLVALKFLPSNLTRDEEAKKRFIQEAQTASALEHANICNIHEINETEDGQMFIAMAYYAGQSLREKIESSRLEVEDALDIANQIARGLDKAHRKNIIHRDIKPANIMITEDDEVIILDFGLAKLAGQTKITKSGTTLGTVSYMSPEQAQGEEVDHQSDIWSLGVILYEMLTGQLPFTGEYDMAVMYAIINTDFLPVTDLNSEVPESVSQVIARSLAKEPEDRYSSIAEMRTALQHPTGDLQEAGKIGGVVTKKRSRKRGAPFYVPLLTFFAILIVLGIYLWRTASTREASPSIAVLPMKSYSETSEEEWFRGSMTDALITDLTKIKELTVIAYTSVAKYKDSDKPVQKIAEELGVNHILDCSILRVGNNIRISPKLIQAEKGENLWAENYQREFSDILILQGEISRAIAEQIKVKLRPREQVLLASMGPVMPKAHEAYLKGRYFLSKRTDESLRKAIEQFEKSIELDPEYALAYAGLADVYIWVAWGYVSTPDKNAFPKSKANAMKALVLDSTLAEAHTAMGLAHLLSENNLKDAENRLKRALEINPGYALSQEYFAIALMLQSQFEKSLAAFSRAESLDPLSPAIKNEIGWVYYFMRDYHRAIKQFQLALDFEPNFPLAHFNIGLAYKQLGEYTEAIAAYKNALAISEGVHWKAGLAQAYAQEGNTKEALRILDEILALNDRGFYVAPEIATIYIGLGNIDRAFEWFFIVAKETPSHLVSLKIEPNYDPLRSDPRFKELVEKAGLNK